MDKLKQFRLPNIPKNKSLNYTEKDLGFKRKYKGRTVTKDGQSWIITIANRTGLVISRDDNNLCLSYQQLKAYTFTD